MRIESFSVQNYRSINQTEKIDLSDFTVLVGANNEGKSNLIEALSTSLQILSSFESESQVDPEGSYEWARDFPIGSQKTSPNGSSVFSLLLTLTPDELVAFRQEVGSKLKESLPIEIRIGKNGRPAFRVKVRGPGAAALSGKSERIAEFVASRLQVVHIPTIRPASLAKERMDRLVRRELLKVSRTDEYRAALKTISDLQQPILQSLSENLTLTLKRFVPDVRRVTLKTAPSRLNVALGKLVEIEVDDGVPTSLERKGDGIQSLSTIALIRHTSEEAAKKRSLVLTVEEPESHLHPHAIHQLKLVLQEISKNNQVVLTTHNPIFVNRANPSSNILVSGNRARVARNVQQIREALGVRAPDNLRSAELVLLVEGEDDLVSIKRLLMLQSPKLKAALASGRLCIDSLKGASHLVFKASFWRADLFSLHAFLDYDKAGRDAFAEAKHEGLMGEQDVNFAIAPGRKESEFEDLLNIDLYASYFFSRWGVDLRGTRFLKDGKQKWSDRVEKSFQMSGKPWDDQIKATAKLDVARLVAEAVPFPIKGNEFGPVQNLLQSLEKKLDSVQA